MQAMLHHPDLPIADLPWMRASGSGVASLGEAFATPTNPTPLPAAHWVGCNDALRNELALPDNLWQQQEALELFTGNRLVANQPTYASVYSGHQFGQWAGQLGDGRALNLGVIQTPDGLQELQLKGAGPTPFRRSGDGQAVRVWSHATGRRIATLKGHTGEEGAQGNASWPFLHMQGTMHAQIPA